MITDFQNCLLKCPSFFDQVLYQFKILMFSYENLCFLKKNFVKFIIQTASITIPDSKKTSFFLDLGIVIEIL